MALNLGAFLTGGGDTVSGFPSAKRQKPLVLVALFWGFISWAIKEGHIGGN